MLALLLLLAAAPETAIDVAPISLSFASARARLQAQPGLEWTIHRRVRDRGIEIAGTIVNRAGAPLRPGRVVLADSELRLGPASAALIMSGWQLPSRVRRVRGAKHLSKTLTQIFDPESGLSAQLGFLTFTRANTEIEITESGGRVRAVASCDFESFELPPGASIETETLRLEAGRDPVAGLRRWAEFAREANGSPRIWPGTPAGWVGWSWVDPFNIERYEDVVRRNARAVREKLPGHAIDYIWVSIGNLANKEPGAWLQWNEKLFPGGVKKLVADLAADRFTLGLWAGAFWMSSGRKEELERLDAALLRKGGAPLTIPHRELGAMYVLDPTQRDTHAFLGNVFRTYREWGVRYYMLDFLYAISGSTPGNYRPDGYFDRSLVPGPQAYRRGLEVIREATGPDTYLLASTGPSLQSIGVLDAIRAGSDYGEGRPLDGPGKGFFPGTFVINKADYWTSHRTATDALASHFFLHRKLSIADTGNVLSVDKPIARADAEISATIFGINGSPLMLGDDLGRIAEDRLGLIRKVFPRLEDAAEPLDLFESPEPDYAKVFRLHVRREWDEWDLIAVFNFGSEPLVRRVPARGLVWDFWNERYEGAAEGEWNVAVPPQSVRLLRIAPRREHPWLLGTDLHVRQGQAEIGRVRWNAAASELEIVAQRPAGERGSVFLHAPKGWSVALPEGLWIARDGNEQCAILRVPLEFNARGPAQRTIRFIPPPPPAPR